jgi:hypothetical protein
MGTRTMLLLVHGLSDFGILGNLIDCVFCFLHDLASHVGSYGN